MKEKDELLKLIEIWTGQEDLRAKIILGFLCFFVVCSIVYIFYALCNLFKFIL